MIFRQLRRTCLGLGRMRRQANLISSENAQDTVDPRDTMSQALGHCNQEQRDQPGK